MSGTGVPRAAARTPSNVSGSAISNSWAFGGDGIAASAHLPRPRRCSLHRRRTSFRRLINALRRRDGGKRRRNEATSCDGGIFTSRPAARLKATDARAAAARKRDGISGRHQKQHQGCRAVRAIVKSARPRRAVAKAGGAFSAAASV